MKDINRQIWAGNNGLNKDNNTVFIIEDKHRSDIDRILMPKVTDVPDNNIFILWYITTYDKAYYSELLTLWTICVGRSLGYPFSLKEEEEVIWISICWFFLANNLCFVSSRWMMSLWVLEKVLIIFWCVLKGLF